MHEQSMSDVDEICRRSLERERFRLSSEGGLGERTIYEHLGLLRVFPRFVAITHSFLAITL